MPAPGLRLVVVALIVFLATFVRSTFGFGEALVGVPLLAFIMPIEVAAPLAVLVSITVAGVAVVQDWKDIHLRSAGWLLLATVVGTPLGLLLLREVDGRVVKMILATVILAFSIWSLARRGHAKLADDRRAWIFGLGAGVLGGAYGMNGPPLVVYGALRGWSPRQFRATLQGYFLPASLLTLAGYGASGLWTWTVNRAFLLTLPLIVGALVLGRALNRRMSPERFTSIIHVGLVVVGAVLLVQSLVEWRGR